MHTNPFSTAGRRGSGTCIPTDDRAVNVTRSRLGRLTRQGFLTHPRRGRYKKAPFVYGPAVATVRGSGGAKGARR